MTDLSSDSPPEASYQVDWELTNTSNIDKVAVEFTDPGTYTEWENDTVPAEDGSVTWSKSTGNPYNENHEITVYVIDDDGNVVDQYCQEDIADGNDNFNDC